MLFDFLHYFNIFLLFSINPDMINAQGMKDQKLCLLQEN